MELANKRKVLEMQISELEHQNNQLVQEIARKKAILEYLNRDEFKGFEEAMTSLDAEIRS